MMSMAFVVGGMIGSFLCVLFVMLIVEWFFLSDTAAIIITIVIQISWLIACPIFTGKSPQYRTDRPYSAKLFEILKALSVGFVAGSTYLLGETDILGLKVFSLVMDSLITLFYLAFIGYSLAFGRRVGLYSYLLCFLSFGSAVFAWHRAFG